MNGARSSSAQPSHSAASACITGPVWSARHQTSTVGPAPEIVAPSAPSSRARSHQRRRARVQVRPVGLVQPVAQAGGDQVPVGRRQPERQGRGAGDVGDRVGDRHLGRAAPRGRQPSRTGSNGTTSTASSSSGAGIRAHVGPVADHEAAAQRRADVVRVALQLGREREQVGVELEQVIGGGEPGHDRRRATSRARRSAGSRSARRTGTRRRARAARTRAPAGWSGRSGRRAR